MKELGIIIAKNGEEFRFGEYHPYIERDARNPHHFHTTSFQEEIVNKEKWKSIGISYDSSKELFQQLPSLASQGVVIALNQTSGTFAMGILSILLVAPSELTSEQKQTLAKIEDEFESYDLGLSTIRIIDKDQKVVEKYDYMKDYYQHIMKEQEKTF